MRKLVLALLFSITLANIAFAGPKEAYNDDFVWDVEYDCAECGNNCA